MRTTMSVSIVITGCTESYKLYERLEKYNANVTDLGDKVYVTLKIDIRNELIEKVLEVCHEFGDCEVNARRV